MDKDYLVLKRASASRPSGEWDDEDFDVLADCVVVGRIYADASASTPPELQWFWSILEVIPDIKTHGHAATREAAMAAFAKTWRLAALASIVRTTASSSAAHGPPFVFIAILRKLRDAISIPGR